MNTQQHNIERHLSERFKTAQEIGYDQRFHLFSSGQVLSMPSTKIYDFEELSDPEREDYCPNCGNTIFYFSIQNSIKGALLKQYED